MQIVIFGFQLLSGIAFLFYGLSCIFSSKMVTEFERYGLKKFRLLTGSLEVLGALGQLASFWLPQLLVVSSLGLACLMACGIWTRWRIRDPWIAFSPAAVLMLINLFLVFASTYG